MKAIERLVEQWRAADIQVGPPASHCGLRALGRLLGAPVPADVATFCELANGMADLEYNPHEVSFWSISRVLVERISHIGAVPDGTFVDLAIADSLVKSWFFSLRSRDGTVTLFVEGSQEELRSSSALAIRYMEALDSLLVLQSHVAQPDATAAERGKGLVAPAAKPPRRSESGSGRLAAASVG